MMFPAHIENALTSVEHLFDEVSAALVSGEPLALSAASDGLRRAAIDFSGLVQGLTAIDRENKNLQSRLKRLSVGLAAQRESLIRRTVLVEMALNAIVPATRDLTYGKAAGSPGAFKYLAA